MDKKIKIVVTKLKKLSDIRVLGLLTFGVLALLLTWSGIKIAQTNYELAKKISVAQQRNQIAQLENENLKLKNIYYDTDLYLELSARRQFGKALPGERLYIVPDDVAAKYSLDKPVNGDGSFAVAENQSKYVKNFNDWLNFLFK